jgi:hypothetical protein
MAGMGRRLPLSPAERGGRSSSGRVEGLVYSHKISGETGNGLKYPDDEKGFGGRR